MKKRTKLFLYGLILIVFVLFIQQSNFISILSADADINAAIMQDKKSILQQLYSQHAILIQEMDEEIILDSIKPFHQDRLVVLSKGRIKAGVDLRLLNESDIFITADSIAIQLPPAEIFDIGVDPTFYSIINQKGNWSNEEIIMLRSKAKSIIEENTHTNKIQIRAENSGKRILEGMLRVIGFKKITLL